MPSPEDHPSDILGLFAGQRPKQAPAFSGLIQLNADSLEREGLVFSGIHRDASSMARAAASGWRHLGLPSATLPHDICVEAEALGSRIDFMENADFVFPMVAEPGLVALADLPQAIARAPGQGRLDLVCAAIMRLKAEASSQLVISGLIPGPYTLLQLLLPPKTLYLEMKNHEAAVIAALETLASLLAFSALRYRQAGADFITVHEMGGSPAFVGPKNFERLVLPPVAALIERLPPPRVLAVCGNAGSSLAQLAAAGAEAVALDQTTDLALARAAFGDTLLFGNIDPVDTLLHGDAAEVGRKVQAARLAGVDAVWPGCDLVPQTPPANLAAWLA